MDKMQELKDFIRKFDKVAIAFSGGVDSATLAALCMKELKDVVALTVVSPAMPSREMKHVKEVAKKIGIKHELIYLNLLEDENFVANTSERCFYCKLKILESILEFCKRHGYSAVFEGTNADELKEHRPGYRAVKFFKNVYSPWAMFNFKKEEIRFIAKKMGFSFYNKPPLACLATRISFGVKIDEKKLKMIDKAENEVLKIFKLKEVRVRFIDDFAVIEAEKEEISKFFNLNLIDEVVRKLKKIGFKRVLLDLEGYKSGKLTNDFNKI